MSRLVTLLAAGLLLLGAGPDRPAEVRLGPGETLEAVAKRFLGDPAAADELRALNKLDKAPAAGASLKLPGPERELAAQAIADAEAKADTDKQKAAVARAREQLRQADYAHARETAELVKAEAGTKSHFTVAVDDAGTTEVAVKDGPAVVVEAAGKKQAVAKNQLTVVKSGAAPEKPVELLPPPSPIEPVAGKTVRGATKGEGLTVQLKWNEVAGARGYVVTVSRDPAGKQLVQQSAAEKGDLELPPLKPGRYYWRVWAKSHDGVNGRPSGAEPFALEAPPPRLEVDKPKWQ